MLNFKNHKTEKVLIVQIKEDDNSFSLNRIFPAEEVKKLIDVNTYTFNQSNEIRKILNESQFSHRLTKRKKMQVINHIIGSVKDYYNWLNNI